MILTQKKYDELLELIANLTLQNSRLFAKVDELEQKIKDYKPVEVKHEEHIDEKKVEHTHKLEEKYNEGLDNIFNYMVNSGLKGVELE